MKIIEVFLLSIFLIASTQLLKADNFPDQQSDATTTHTPYSMHQLSSSPVQLGMPDAGGTGIPYYNTAPQAYSPEVFHFFFNDSASQTNYFTKGASDVDSSPINRHFNLQLFKSQHEQAFQNTSFHYSSTAPMTVYFIDTAAGFTNALGIIDRTEYPSSPFTHPLLNMGGKDCLLFPYTRTAIPTSRTMRNIDEGGARSSDYTPYLLSDFVKFSILPGQSIDFFLASNIAGKDTADPASAKGVWFTDMAKNWGNGGIDSLNFQHFQFYTVPELDLLTPGFHNLLVAVEDLGSFNNTDRDFNDLVFLFQTACQVPEPATYLLLGTLLSIAFIVARRPRVFYTR
jgi:hypothetical protein